MRKTGRKAVALLLALLLCLTPFNAPRVVAEAGGEPQPAALTPVSYRAYDEATGKMTTLSVDDYIVLNADMPLPEGYNQEMQVDITNGAFALGGPTAFANHQEQKPTYVVVEGTVTISPRLFTFGEVHLILTDGATLNLLRGLSVVSFSGSMGNRLYIHSQSADPAAMGTINAWGNSMGRSLAGNYGKNLIDYDPELQTYYNDHEEGDPVPGIPADYTETAVPWGSAAIGGEMTPDNTAGRTGNGPITIDGGNINAYTHYYGAAIGSTHGSIAGPITINGGKILAYAGRISNAAGIGAGARSRTTEITIRGGEITANGNGLAADIGGGGHLPQTAGQRCDTSGGRIVVSGGTFTFNHTQHYQYPTDADQTGVNFGNGHTMPVKVETGRFDENGNPILETLEPGESTSATELLFVNEQYADRLNSYKYECGTDEQNNIRTPLFYAVIFDTANDRTNGVVCDNAVITTPFAYDTGMTLTTNEDDATAVNVYVNFGGSFPKDAVIKNKAGATVTLCRLFEIDLSSQAYNNIENNSAMINLEQAAADNPNNPAVRTHPNFPNDRYALGDTAIAAVEKYIQPLYPTTWIEDLDHQRHYYRHRETVNTKYNGNRVASLTEPTHISTWVVPVPYINVLLKHDFYCMGGQYFAFNFSRFCFNLTEFTLQELHFSLETSGWDYKAFFADHEGNAITGLSTVEHQGDRLAGFFRGNGTNRQAVIKITPQYVIEGETFTLSLDAYGGMACPEEEHSDHTYAVAQRDITISDIARTYTITIPAEVNAGESFEVKGENLLGGHGRRMWVKVNSQNGFKLKLEGAPDTASLPYQLTGEDATPIDNGGNVFVFTGQGLEYRTDQYKFGVYEVTNGDPAYHAAQQSSSVQTAVLEAPSYSGTYTDALTFTVYAWGSGQYPEDPSLTENNYDPSKWSSF